MIYIILLASILPAIVYLFVIRNSEAHQREGWRWVYGAFFWGVAAAIMSAFGELIFSVIFRVGLLTTAIIIAPVIEEVFKPLIFFGKKSAEIEDTMIYCASAGIGFACIENALYFAGAEAGVLPLIIVARTIDGYMIHASTSGLTGLGIAKKRTLSHLMGAIIIHSISNLFILKGGAMGFIISIFMAILLFSWMRRSIKKYDSAYRK